MILVSFSTEKATKVEQQDCGERKFLAHNNALVILPDGGSGLSGEAVQKLHRTGSIGGGQLIEKRRSVVVVNEKEGVVQKTSTRPAKQVVSGEKGPRFAEFRNMQELGAELAATSVADTIGVVGMLAYSVRPVGKGKCRERIVMQPARGISLAKLPDGEYENAMNTLSPALERARQEGVSFSDLGASNIFCDRSSGSWKFTLIDQDR